MRLATAHVLHGRSPQDGLVDTGRLARALASLDADVVALQDVDRGQDRSHRTDQTEVAALACGAVASHFTAAVVGTHGSRMRRADGSEDPAGTASGIAVVSRLPVSAWREVRLPPVPVPVPVRSPARGGVRWAREEPRVALCALVQTRSGPLTVVATQLSALPGRSAVQLRRLAAVVTAAPGPLVLLGDLHLGAGTPARITGLTPLVTADTYPAAAPRVQVDHVLGRGVRVLAASAVRMPVSDHCALVVDVELDEDELDGDGDGEPSAVHERVPAPDH